MNEIVLADHESLNRVATAMKHGDRFAIVTEDKNFNPLGHDVHSAQVWIAAAGGGVLMAVGAGALIAAFASREPISQVSLIALGGLVLTLTGGLVLLSILTMRSKYECQMEVDASKKKFRFLLQPKAV